MRILYLLPTSEEFRHGIWFYRNRTPARALRERGHEVKMAVFVPPIASGWFKITDVVVFRGVYPVDPIPELRKFKRKGIRVVYDSDDDMFTVNPDNPAQKASKEKLEQYSALLSEADVVTTTTEILKKRFLKFNKNVAVVPNALDFTEFIERRKQGGELKVGYTGGASHWGDLEMILDVIEELQKKYQFKFVLQGMTGSPLVAEMYTYKYYLDHQLQPEKNEYFKTALKVFAKLRGIYHVHIPWYPPELYPSILSGMDLDIGICPLKDNKFNQAKSCIKFYEYAAVGTVCLASDVMPYKKECCYRAKNKFKDWYKKLERLIVDEKFREKILNKQWAFVEKNRNIREVVKEWEKVFGYDYRKS